MIPQRTLENGELSGTFILRDPDWRAKLFFGGLLLLLLPPFGWPVALGYRKELISHLFAGRDPLLPEWRGNLGRYFTEGLKALVVIFGYLSPLYGVLPLFLAINGVSPELTWLYVVLFFVAFPIFSPLSFPFAVMYWSVFAEGYRLPGGVAVSLLVLFGVVVFFIPAAFLQVSKSGRYRAAFNLRAAFRTLRNSFNRYLLAWYRSAVMSLCGHLAIPFAPWGVIWCYLGIIFEFNSILVDSKEIDGKGSWFARLHADDQTLIARTSTPSIFEYATIHGGSDARCSLLKLGPILIPLPRVISVHLRRSEN